jgi:TetR/AcrR family transcriptional repressor of nem operon
MLAARKNPKRRATRLRDSERTRERLLQAAFREVYKVGFQSAGIDAILAATNVTKGALYYHFENKQALGYAVVEEIVAKLPRDRWLLPLQQSKDKDPIDALIGIVQAIPARPRDVKGGCALVNLAQEMSQLDEQFRKRLERIFHAWQEGIAMALRRGRRLRSVGKEFSRCEGVEYGNQKYRGLADFSSRAGQPQPRLIASLPRSSLDVDTYQPVCMSALHRLPQGPEARVDGGLMVRRGMIRSVLLNNNCGEIQPTQE